MAPHMAVAGRTSCLIRPSHFSSFYYTLTRAMATHYTKAAGLDSSGT